MITDYIFAIKEDGTMSQSGVNYGYGDKANPVLIGRTENYAVVKEPGCTDWSGRGQTSYYPATWYLVRAKFIKGSAMKVIEILRREEPGKGWHAYKKELLAEMHQLEGRQNASDS